jgi:hypothetical protein
MTLLLVTAAAAGCGPAGSVAAMRELGAAFVRLRVGQVVEADSYSFHCTMQALDSQPTERAQTAASQGVNLSSTLAAAIQ